MNMTLFYAECLLSRRCVVIGYRLAIRHAHKDRSSADSSHAVTYVFDHITPTCVMQLISHCRVQRRCLDVVQTGTTVACRQIRCTGYVRKHVFFTNHAVITQQPVTSVSDDRGVVTGVGFRTVMHNDCEKVVHPLQPVIT